MAVNIPALMVALVNASVNNIFAPNFVRPSALNKAMMLMQTGNRIAVRAVLDGIRKDSMMLARVIPIVIRNVVLPTMFSIRYVSRSANFVFIMAAAKTKAPNIKNTEEEAKGAKPGPTLTIPIKTARGTMAMLVATKGMDSVR